MKLVVGELIPLQLQLSDGLTTMYPQAILRDDTGAIATVDLAHVADQVERLLDPIVAGGGVAGEVAELAEDDEHGDAGQEADHHRVGDEAREAPQPQQPGAELEQADQDD